MSSISRNNKIPASSTPHVMVLEGLNEPVGESPHAHDVARAAQRVLPESNLVKFSFRQRQMPSPTSHNTYDSIKGIIENMYMRSMHAFAENLKQISKLSPSQRPNAVNFSIGMTELDLLQVMRQKQPKKLFNIATQNEKTSLFDTSKKDTHGIDWKLPALESYIDETLENSKTVAKAKKEAEQSVERLKKQNVAVVVAVGNVHAGIEAFKKEHPGVLFESDEGQNLYALKNVVTVGASETDGTLTKYSSRGPEVDFTTQVPPRIAGRSILTKGQYGTYESGTKQGTSFTAPVVTGMLAILTNQEGMGMTVDEAIAYLKDLGTQKQDDTPERHSYTDLNLEEVAKIWFDSIQRKQKSRTLA